MMARLRSLLPFILLQLVGSAHASIDTHFHALPQAYLQALTEAGGDPSRFPTPNWSIDAAIGSLNAVGSSLGVMSISSPGVPIAGTGSRARILARQLNHDFGNYTTDPKYSSRTAFFGVLPDWCDTEGTLNELDFLYLQQKLCFGVTVYTTYGGKLLSDPAFIPIWQRLESYKALIFLHPGLLDVEPRFISNGVPQPIIDYPIATTRTAVDLVMAGVIRKYKDVDIILSHAGGTVPFLGNRAIGGLAIPAVASVASVSQIEAVADFGRFYYDIALSTSNPQLDGLLGFTDPSHILFGSDFPYAPPLAVQTTVQGYRNYVANNSRGALIAPEKLKRNAIMLLNKHSQGRKLS